MRNWHRLIPYLSLGLAALIVLGITTVISNPELRTMLLGVSSTSILFFTAYLFYDLIRQVVLKKEKRYLEDYIKNKIANDISVALYYLKNIVHGYNLETNTLQDLFSVVNYSTEKINDSVKNQEHLGFQIFKNIDEIRSLLGEALGNNLIVNYFSHWDSISILRMSNNLAKIESIMKFESSYEKCAETGIEFAVVNGQDINPANDDNLLLMKKTDQSDKFVVYDSGYFEKDKMDLLLNRYVLKEMASHEISQLLHETFSLMKYWIPEPKRLSKNESRFRVIKELFSPNTYSKTMKSKIFVADIVEINKST